MTRNRYINNNMTSPRICLLSITSATLSHFGASAYGIPGISITQNPISAMIVPQCMRHCTLYSNGALYHNPFQAVLGIALALSQRSSRLVYYSLINCNASRFRIARFAWNFTWGIHTDPDERRTLDHHRIDLQKGKLYPDLEKLKCPKKFPNIRDFIRQRSSVSSLINWLV